MNQETPLQPLRWGILGAARIARKAVINAIRAQGGVVAAIGASTRDRAEIFGCEFDIPMAFEGYQAVLDRDDIDAVYILAGQRPAFSLGAGVRPLGQALPLRKTAGHDP